MPTTITVTLTLDDHAAAVLHGCAAPSSGPATDVSSKTHDRGERPVTSEGIIDCKSHGIVFDALTAAFQDIYAVQDRRKSTAYRLSRTFDKLALALRAMGSSASEALQSEAI